MGIAQFCCLNGLDRGYYFHRTVLEQTEKVASFSFMVFLHSCVLHTRINDLVQLMWLTPSREFFAGGLSAFLVGVIACRIMVQLVRNKLYTCSVLRNVGIATIFGKT